LLGYKRADLLDLPNCNCAAGIKTQFFGVVFEGNVVNIFCVKRPA
jgi:hypothetical protein